MPIRFTCSNCHQRLSVRPEKAGQQVKCPTCREVMVVPTETASDEPGSLADAEAPPRGEPAEWSEFAVYDRDDELVYLPDASQADAVARHDLRLVTFPRRILYLQGFLLGAVSLLFFVLGIVVGARSTDSPRDRLAAQPCVVDGRVTYADARNQQVPDAGSALFLLPTGTRPDEKILVEGLRVDDPPLAPGDRGVTLLHDLGGDLARADAQGRFRMRVPRAGRYFLLVISRHARRDPDSQPAPHDLAEMGRYFVPASELVERSRYEWRQVLIESDRQIDTAF